MSDQQYYTKIQGEISGPYSDEEISRLVRGRKLGRIHQLSTDGVNWSRAEDYPEFFSVVTPDLDARVDAGQARHPGGGGVNPAPQPMAWEEPPGAEEYALGPAPDSTFVPNAAPPSGPPPGSSVAPAGQDTTEWFYVVDLQRHGPVSKAALDQLIASGKVTPHDSVWSEGMDDWMQIQALPNVFATPAPAATNNVFVDPKKQGKSRSSRRGSHAYARYSGMAIASLVISLIPIFGLNCPLAIVFGIIGIQQVTTSDGRLKGLGLAVCGIVIATVSIFGWLGYFFLFM